MGAAVRAENQRLLLKEPLKKSLKRLRRQCLMSVSSIPWQRLGV